MRKFFAILLYTALFMIFMTTIVLADSNVGGNVTIDTPWTTLETSVEALAGITNEDDVITLIITVSDTLSGVDIEYVNSMINLQSLGSPIPLILITMVTVLQPTWGIVLYLLIQA